MSAIEDQLKERHKVEKELRAEIAADERAETAEVEKRLGRKLTQKDSDYWQLAEKYRQRYFDEVMTPRKKMEDLKKAEDKKETQNPVTASKTIVTERICKTCDNIIAPSGKRGRPATRCEECRAKKDEPVVEDIPIRNVKMLKVSN